MRETSICCDCVLAEIAPVFATNPLENCQRLLVDWQITFVPSNVESAVCAGEMFKQYRQRGQRSRVFADFLIGAHALTFANRLMTRDHDYQKDYFKGLEVVLIQ